ncbi:hypothetical protein AZE42_11781 [Rhizopogon vesiculosus]|uniref:Uncharacterized protein n=1 Tax=Rhizopogon vesiculosus TaxID=180088 RepID=A0A1J8QNV0_9AGAM|nr:hypothetical protein AZE42_11781 [Rhizopogon vesiculosus]
MKRVQVCDLCKSAKAKCLSGALPKAIDTKGKKRARTPDKALPKCQCKQSHQCNPLPKSDEAGPSHRMISTSPSYQTYNDQAWIKAISEMVSKLATMNTSLHQMIVNQRTWMEKMQAGTSNALRDGMMLIAKALCKGQEGPAATPSEAITKESTEESSSREMSTELSAKSGKEMETDS